VLSKLERESFSAQTNDGEYCIRNPNCHLLKGQKKNMVLIQLLLDFLSQIFMPRQARVINNNHYASIQWVTPSG
jgi:hypothetical protein